MALTQHLMRAGGRPPFTTAFLAATSGHLRILAYHGLHEPGAFERQLQHLAERYTVVSLRAVVDAVTHHRPLPERSVWLTFDDGIPEVVTLAQPLLDRYGFTATLFICPGVVDTSQPYWWEIVREAEDVCGPEIPRLGYRGVSLEAALKRCPDSVRRAYVEQLATAVVEQTGRSPRQRQLRSDELWDWVAAGHEVGNHTWDHPLLDRCEANQQVEQIEAAHEWLQATLGAHPAAFAYPNGNWSRASEGTLRRLGYRIGLGFDHRMADLRHTNPLRLARLRANADDEIVRFRPIVAGIHSRIFSMKQWLQHPLAHRADPRRLPR
jgi:peptidoglycan/xylan/chitin deacetylase (PgdA/CDA1 family)